MKIGIFDSGVGGLIIAQAIINRLPDYDYINLGDTAHVPYGDRPAEEVYEFTQQAVDYLFRHDCQLIILACNTASAETLRKLQQEYLPGNFPDRRILGVIIPTVEAAVAANPQRIGVLATTGTIQSKAFVNEIHKLSPAIAVFQEDAPLLVPLIEAGRFDEIDSILMEHIDHLRNSNIDSLILGCTHYCLLKDHVKQVAGDMTVISEDEVIPHKLVEYLEQHSEHVQLLDKQHTRSYLVTQETEAFIYLFNRLVRSGENLEQITLAD